jgi:hypothetical protein
MAGARHGMCELTRQGRGTAWARHLRGMAFFVLVEAAAGVKLKQISV